MRWEKLKMKRYEWNDNEYLNENGVISTAFKRWTWKYDILVQATENILKNKKAQGMIWSEWQSSLDEHNYDAENC